MIAMPAYRRALVVVLFSVTACSTETRCRDIALQEAMAHADQLRENDFEKAYIARYSPNLTPEQDAKLRRGIRARWMADLRASAKQRGSTSFPAYSPQDSAEPKRTPPPRPSDRQWSAEHCFQGHAR